MAVPIGDCRGRQHRHSGQIIIVESQYGVHNPYADRFAIRQ